MVFHIKIFIVLIVYLTSTSALYSALGRMPVSNNEFEELLSEGDDNKYDFISRLKKWYDWSDESMIEKKWYDWNRNNVARERFLKVSRMLLSDLILPIISKARNCFGPTSLVVKIEFIRYIVPKSVMNDVIVQNDANCIALTHAIDENIMISALCKRVVQMDFDPCILMAEFLSEFQYQFTLKEIHDIIGFYDIEVWQGRNLSEKLFIAHVSTDSICGDNEFFKLIDKVLSCSKKLNFHSDSPVESISDVVMISSRYEKLFIHYQCSTDDDANLTAYDARGIKVAVVLGVKMLAGEVQDCIAPNRVKSDSIDLAMENNNCASIACSTSALNAKANEKMDRTLTIHNESHENVERKFRNLAESTVQTDEVPLQSSVIEISKFCHNKSNFSFKNEGKDIYASVGSLMTNSKAKSLEFTHDQRELEKTILIKLEKYVNDKLSIEKNFVSLGMDSIKLALLEETLRQSIAHIIDIPYGVVFKHPNIKSLAEYLTTYIHARDVSQNSPSINHDEIRTDTEWALHAERFARYDVMAKKFNSEHYSNSIDELRSMIKERQNIPLSSAQERLIVIHGMNTHGTNQSQLIEKIRIKVRNVDLQRFKTALNGLIARQTILRTKYGTFYQFVVSLTESYIAAVMENNETDMGESMDIFSDIPLCISFNWKDEYSKELILKISQHHASTDGYSMKIMATELLALYVGTKLPRLKFHYAHYAIAEKNFEKAVPECVAVYWRDKFHDFQSTRQIDKHENIDKEFIKRFIEVEFPKSTAIKINNLVDRFAKSEFQLLYSICNILLHKRYDINDICNGILVSNRSESALNPIMGCLINILPIRIQIEPYQSFQWLLSVVSESLNDARIHQVSFRKVLSCINRGKDSKANPLFRTLIIMDDRTFINNDDNHSSVNWSVIDYDSFIGLHDHVWCFVKAKSGLSFRIEYNGAIFHNETVNSLLSDFIHLVDQIHSEFDKNLSTISLVRNYQKLKLYNERLANKCDYPSRKRVIDIAHQQSRINIYTTSVLYAGELFSNVFIANKSNHVAAYIMQEIVRKSGGVIHADLVVVLIMRRTIEMLVILLGLWKCNIAVVPLCIDWPLEQLILAIRSLRCPLVIVSEEMAVSDRIDWFIFANDLIQESEIMCRNFEQGGIINYIDTVPRNRQASCDLAYITFTSGSTGSPKGICTEWIGLSNLAMNYAKLFYLNEMSVVYQVVNPTFDIFFADVIETFCFGGKMVLAASKIPDWSEVKSVTHAYIMPAYLSAVSESNIANFRHLHAIAFGGDFIHKRFLESAIRTGIQLYQQYGLTESTIYTTCKRMKILDDPSMIGKPFHNTNITIRNSVDENFAEKHCAFGCIDGIGLARGYIKGNKSNRNFRLNTHLLTEESISSNDRRYLWTGDRIECSPNQKEFKFFGRLDSEIKIRGLLVNVNCIEYIISSIHYVKSCIVDVKKSSDSASNVLLAYIILRKNGNSVDLATEIPKYLKMKLPEFMIPRHYMSISEFPLNFNGKLDRSRLQFIEPKQVSIKTSKKLTSVERRIYRIFAETLSRDMVLPEESFLNIGGDSLQALLAIQRINAELAVTIPLQNLFEQMTFAELLSQGLTNLDHSKQYVKQNDAVEFWLDKSGIPLSFNQKRLWYLQKFIENDRSYIIRMNLHLSRSINVSLLEIAANYLIRNQKIFRTTIYDGLDHIPTQIVLSLTESFISFTTPRHLTDEYVFSENDFQMNEAPPIKIHLDQNAQVFIIKLLLHHILVDEHSLHFALVQLFDYYETLLTKGRMTRMPACHSVTTYAEYAYRQWNNWEKYTESAAEWIEELKSAESLKIPSDFQRPKIFTAEGTLIAFKIDIPMLTIRTFCMKNNCTVFVYLISCFGLLLQTLSGQNKFIVETPSINREVDSMITVGYFSNSIPVFLNLDLLNVHDLIKRVQKSVTNALNHQHIPFEYIIERLNPIRDPSCPAIFQYSIVLENPLAELRTPKIAEIVTKIEELHSGGTKFDQTWFFTQRKSCLELKVEYCNSLFEQSTVRRSVSIYEAIMRSMLIVEQLHEIDRGFPAHNDVTSVGNLVQPSDEGAIDDTMRKLIRIWKKFLKITSIKQNDNFFTIGGHSLVAIRVCKEISQEFKINLQIHDIFLHQTIEDLAKHVLDHSPNKIKRWKESHPEMVKTRLPRACELQISILKMYASDPAIVNMRAYETGFSVETELLNRKHLQICLNRIILSHTSLRTRFMQSGDDFYQAIHSGTETFIHISHYLEEVDPLLPSPLKDIALICYLALTNDRNAIIKFVVSHVLVDGYSLEMIGHELHECYSNRFNLPQNRTDYTAFSDRCNAEMQRNETENLIYWRKVLGGQNFGELETDKLRSSIQVNNGGFYRRKFSRLSKILRNLAKSNHCTPTAVILAGLSKVFALQMPNDSKIAIGVPFDMRSDSFENVVGFCVNTLPLIIDPNESFTNICLNITVQVENAIRTLYIAPVVLNNLLDIDHNQVSVMVVVNYSDRNLVESKEFRLLNETPAHTKFELTVFVYIYETYVQVEVEFMRNIFYYENIEALLEAWAHLLLWQQEQIFVDSDKLQQIKRLYALKLSTEKSNRSNPADIDESGNSYFTDGLEAFTTLQHRHDQTRLSFPRILRNSLQFSGENLSFSNDNEQISYNVLLDTINRMSFVIQQKVLQYTGEMIRPDQITPIVAKKSLNILVMCLSIIHCGCAYLPIDESNPEHRINNILDQTACKIFICKKDTTASIKSTCRIGLSLDIIFKIASSISSNRNMRLRNKSNDIGYVIFTSGSTNQPKGALIKQESIANLIIQSTQNFFMIPTDNVYQFTNFAFDNSVLEMVMALANGCSIHVEENIFDIRKFLRKLESLKITHVLLFPGIAHLFDEEEFRELSKLRYWIVGAEKLDDKTLNLAISNGINVIQNYGPTETTAYAISKHMRHRDVGCNIGKPIPNVKLSVQRYKGLNAPKFVAGHLHISGVCVMRGYLRGSQASLKSSNTFYTGDIVKILPNNDCIFVGRSDRQIKIRGFRVELAEIEDVIRQIVTIKQVRVVFRKDIQSIVAYITTKRDSESAFDPAMLRRYCIKSLPYYMIPSQFHYIEEFPLTTNSKISLDELLRKQNNTGELTETTENKDEMNILSLFEDVLNISTVSSTDDFFIIGGNSLSAIRLAGRISQMFECVVDSNFIFKHRTVRGLLLAIETMKGLNNPSVEHALKSSVEKVVANGMNLNEIPLSYQQNQMLFLNETNQKDYYNLPFVQTFDGDIDRNSLEFAFNRLIMRQLSLRTAFVEKSYNVYQQILSGTEAYFHISLISYSKATLSNDIVNLKKRIQILGLEPPFQCMSYYSKDTNVYTVLLVINHIISDAWSTRLIEAELSQLYAHYRNHGKFRDNKIEFTYAHFSHRQYANQRDQLRLCEELTKNIVYAVNIEQNFLTFCHSKALNDADHCFSIKLVLANQVKCLTRYSSTIHATPFVVLLGSLMATLHRLSETAYIPVTVVSANRMSDVQKLVGNFLNNLLIVSAYQINETLEEYLVNINETARKNRKYESVPYQMLVESLNHQTALTYDRRLALTETYFNCRYDLEDGSSNLLTAAKSHEIIRQSRCAYPLEVDIDTIDDDIEYSFRIRSDVGSKDDLIHIQRSVEITYMELCDILAKKLPYSDRSVAGIAKLSKVGIVTQTNGTKLEIELPENACAEIVRSDLFNSPVGDELSNNLKVIWQQCLNRVPYNENFFLSGGNSLLCLKMQRMIRDQLEIELEIAEIFNNPTIDTMLNLIRFKKKKLMELEKVQSILMDFGGETWPNLLVLFHPLIGGIVLPYASLIKCLNDIKHDFHIVGVQHPTTFKRKQVEPSYTRSITSLCSEYVKCLSDCVRRSELAIFIGASFGGILAYECALQFHKQGKYINKVVCIDTNASEYNMLLTFEEHQLQMNSYMAKNITSVEVSDELKDAAIDSSWELLKLAMCHRLEVNGEIDLVLLRTVCNDSEKEEDYGWSKFCRTTCIEIRGDHQTMLEEENSKSLSITIADILAKKI